MSFHLLLLALQSIHRISRKLGISVDLPSFFELYGLPPEFFNKAISRVSSILEELVSKHRVSWWSVYLESDIGKERILIAKEIGLSSRDRVVDIGCGRGYFTIAATRLASQVVGVDLMNGFSRPAWWFHFNRALELLGLSHKVQGVRADACRTPFRDSCFDIATAVHCVRNFRSTNDIIGAIKEMKRIVRNNGYVVIVENLPEARNELQEAHLKLHSIRVKLLRDELDYFSREELVEMVNRVGFKDVQAKIVDYNLCSTPALFYVDAKKLHGKAKDSTLEEYERTIHFVRKHGEASTPVIIIKARK